MDLNLKGRTVLITGGSRGIESIANVMAQEGCGITIAASYAEILKQVARDVTETTPGTEAGIGVPKIVQAHASQTSALGRHPLKPAALPADLKSLHNFAGPA